MPQLNTFAFDTMVFGGMGSLNTVPSTDTLVFENFSLSDGTNMVLQSLVFKGPTRDLVGGNIPRADGMYLTSDYFREYTIEASGIAVQSSAAALDAYLDTVRKSLRKREGNLDYTDKNGTVKRFVATLDAYEDLFANRQGWNITVCPWKASFKCKTPFGRARSYTATSLTFSSSPTSQSFVNAGTYKAPAVFTLIFSSASSVTSIDVTNTLTGEEITYTGTASANDVFVFDGENKQVTKNGTAVDFTGSFPNLDLGGNVCTFTINGTFSVNLTGKFRTTYL
jgi:hypothetical protein